jgi:hypothetical protein
MVVSHDTKQTLLYPHFSLYITKMAASPMQPVSPSPCLANFTLQSEALTNEVA